MNENIPNFEYVIQSEVNIAYQHSGTDKPLASTPFESKVYNLNIQLPLVFHLFNSPMD